MRRIMVDDPFGWGGFCAAMIGLPVGWLTGHPAVGGALFLALWPVLALSMRP